MNIFNLFKKERVDVSDVVIELIKKEAPEPKFKSGDIIIKEHFDYESNPIKTIRTVKEAYYYDLHHNQWVYNMEIDGFKFLAKIDYEDGYMLKSEYDAL